MNDFTVFLYSDTGLPLLVMKMVGLGRLELPTSPLSGVRSKPTELQTHLRGGRILQ